MFDGGRQINRVLRGSWQVDVLELGSDKSRHKLGTCYNIFVGTSQTGSDQVKKCKKQMNLDRSKKN